MGPTRVKSIGVRYYGALAEHGSVDVIAASATAGVLRPVLSSAVTIVNARDVARQRAIDVVESRSTRRRDYLSLLSIKLETSEGDRIVEGTVFDPGNLRLVGVQGIGVEATLSGTIVLIANDDQPGVIGEVGTILGRRGVNIASFALGRGAGGAIGVVNVDEDPGETAVLDGAIGEIRRVAAIREVHVVRLS
jgi:D-3-phosphoglycerate dehydrogenase